MFRWHSAINIMAPDFAPLAELGQLPQLSTPSPTTIAVLTCFAQSGA